MILINSSPKDALKIFQPFLPIFIPVGVGCLAAAADRAGVRAEIVDEQVEHDALGKIEEYLQGMEKPYIFAFSVLTAALKNAVSLSIELKRRYPDSIVVFGGIHPTALPDDVMKMPHVDAVIRGEGETPLIEYYRAVKNKGDLSVIKGLTYRKDGSVVHNPVSDVIEDLDSYPPFPYHRFSPKDYDLGFVISSRGCPYKCIFCSNRVTTGKRYRHRSSEAIAGELKMLNAQYGRSYILFLDDNFLVNKKRVYELIDEIKKRGLHEKMTFNFQARGDNVNPELLKDLHAAGFRSVFFGLETASEEVMTTIKKGETVKQCVDAVKMAKSAGFHVSATFIYALPGETHKDRMDAVMLANELDLDMVRFNNATPYPGTELHEIATAESNLFIKGTYENFNSVSTFIENPFRKIPFTYVPKGNTEQEIRMDILCSYLAFYLDFKRLKSIFASPDKGVGWFNAGDRILEFFKKVPALALLGVLLSVKFSELFFYMLKKDSTLSLSEIVGLFKKRREFRKQAFVEQAQNSRP